MHQNNALTIKVAMSSNKPFSVIAFDYGTKNIGVAIGQSVTKSAQSAPPLKAKDGIPNWPLVEKLLGDWQAKQVVVGLPLNMDGSESELCKRARKFGNRLHGRYGVEVHFLDERLTTREAKSIARDQGYTGSNYAENPVDGIAAQLILEDFWRAAP